MTQVSKHPLSKNVSEKVFNIFVNTLLNVQKTSEAQELISDFLTPTERIMLAKRLGIVFFLEKGYKYEHIKEILKVSTATIAHVNRSRQFGSNGYKKFISKIIRDEFVSRIFDEFLINLTALPAKGTKGSGMWKYLHKEFSKNKKKY